MIGADLSTEEDDIDAMLEDQSDAIIEEIQIEQEEINDTTMTDKDHNTTNQQHKEQQETTTAAIAEGDFSHQFGDKTKFTDKINNNTSTGVNRQ
jgi:hypothetical protein